MKSFFLWLFVCILLIFSSSGCRPKDMEVTNVSTALYENSYTQTLTILLNDDSVTDYTACAKEIVSRILANNFPNVIFSYDILGYPSEINASVYAQKSHIKNGTVLFSFHYKRNKSGEEIYTIQ